MDNVAFASQLNEEDTGGVPAFASFLDIIRRPAAWDTDARFLGLEDYLHMMQTLELT